MGLRQVKKDYEEVKAEVESLDKALAMSKTSEGIALERGQKATKVADNLRKEVDAERLSSGILTTEVKLLKEQLDAAKTSGLAAAEAYSAALFEFGSITPPLPLEVSPPSLLTWMSSNFAKLPGFVGKVGDFAALASATNLAKTLSKAGCEHVVELKHKKEHEHVVLRYAFLLAFLFSDIIMF